MGTNQHPIPPLTITTILKSGGEYNETHAENLYKMTLKHAPGHQFNCLTDMSPNCPHTPLQHNWPGWWSKIEILNYPHPQLYLDLDTIITGNITQLLQKLTHYNFTILREWKNRNHKNKTTKQKATFNSSLLSTTTPLTHPYNTFKQNPNHYITEFKGDDNYLQDTYLDHQITPPPPKYKIKYAYTNDLTNQITIYSQHNWQTNPINPNTQKIIIFQGHPKPWEQTNIPYPS